MQPHHKSSLNSTPQKDNMELFTIYFKHHYCCVLGVYHYERLSKQLIMVELGVSFKESTIVQSVMLDKMNQIISNALNNEKPLLLERLAFILGDLIIEEYPFIVLLDLTIKKPNALRYAENANVTIRITQQGSH